MASAQIFDFTAAYAAGQGQPPRIGVLGLVKSVKLVDNEAYGSRWRFLVVTTDGASVWCSVPVALQQAVSYPSNLIGRVVSFEARINRLPDGDLLYGTYPSKGTLDPTSARPCRTQAANSGKA